MASNDGNALDDIFDRSGKAGTTEKSEKELVFHHRKFNQPGQTADSANVLTFVRPQTATQNEDVPVQNSLTFEETDRPFRRFPQHLLEIMRRAEQESRVSPGRAPLPLSGILTINEDLVAWVAVRGQFDTTLVLFSANPEKSEVAVPATHVEVEDVVSVCAVPQPSADGANHLIAIATVSGVRLYRLLVCSTSIVIDVSTNIYFSIPDVAVTSIVAADTGRLFAGCVDGWVYELQYMDNISSWWRPPKIRKVAPSVNGSYPAVALSYLPAPLFIRDRVKQWFSEGPTKLWSHMPVVDMCVHSSAVVAPSKIFLWALEKEECFEREHSRDEAAASSANAASVQEKRYKSALQLYEVHASGLKLLHTYNDNNIKSQHKGTWISKIFTVEPWQEEDSVEIHEVSGSSVARVCAVFANGKRAFYKYDISKSTPFTQYAVHSPSPDNVLRNDDLPCCFHNGRYVRVNRSNSSIISAYRSSFENAIADVHSTSAHQFIPAVSRQLRCAHPAGHKMQMCVVAPVPMPSEIGRLISIQRHPAKAFEDIIPRTVHDAFWQAHCEHQDYLVLYSYGSDRCGITLVSEYSLRGRIRQAFRRQEAEQYRSAIEDAFLRRSPALCNPLYKDNLTTIYQSSLIKATQLSLHIDCKLSANTSDISLIDAMKRRVDVISSKEITSNAFRFCIYNALCPLYRVSLFSLSHLTEANGSAVAIPTLALRENPQRWKYLRDFLEQIVLMSQQQHFLQVSNPKQFTHEKIIEGLQGVIEIASILFVLTHLFRRAPPLLVATGIKRCVKNKELVDNCVEDLLGRMKIKAHYSLLDAILVDSKFDVHLDQELRTYMRQYCPDYCREKDFLSVIESLVAGETPSDSSFRKLKMNTIVPSANAFALSAVNQRDCSSIQSAIGQKISDYESILTSSGFDLPRVKSDMKFLALLLGYTDTEFTVNSAKSDYPMFFLNPENPVWDPNHPLKPWVSSGLPPPIPSQLSKTKNPFPFIFQLPVRILCLQLRRVRTSASLEPLNDNFPRGAMTIPLIYEQSLQQLLSMAFYQKMILSVQSPANALSSKLFQDAVEVALSTKDKYCTAIVCNWLKPKVKCLQGGFTPLHVLHTYPDTEPFFAVIATSQHYPHVEAWIMDQIDLPVTTADEGKSCTFYCCMLLEYLHFHNRWSDFCKKSLEIVNHKGYRVSLDHKVAWLHVALNSTNGRSPQEMPQKGVIIDQIQLCLKVLHLHKLAHDRLCNLLTVQPSDYSRIKRFAIHFRMWNSRNSPWFCSFAGTGPSHKFEDFNHRVGPYDNQRAHRNGKFRGCLRDEEEGGNFPTPGTSMLGTMVNERGTFEKGLLARYRDDLCDGEIAYPDHASFRKILSNSMFFDLEIMLMHTVLPIQNQQDIQKCIEKIMVQSWFMDQTTSEFAPTNYFLPLDDMSLNQAKEEAKADWGLFCMRNDFDEKYVTMSAHRLEPLNVHLGQRGVQIAIESLRRHVHNFFEVAPKSQDVLRIMFPPELLVTFACTHIAHAWPSPRVRRHYVCAIADILLGYTSPLSEIFFDVNMSSLTTQKAHYFISYNALQPEGYYPASAPQNKRTKGRDRCVSLKTLWDALPHIARNLPDEKFLTTKLAFAARLACETAASIRFDMLQDRPAVDFAMQQYRVYHDRYPPATTFPVDFRRNLFVSTPSFSRSPRSIKQLTPRFFLDHGNEDWTEDDVQFLKDQSEEWYSIIMRRA